MLWFIFFNKKEFCSELPFIKIQNSRRGKNFLWGGGIPGPPPLYEALI